MPNLPLILIAIIALFSILIIGKSLIKRQFCVLCASVSLTWIALYVLYRFGYFSDTVLLGILMGQSATGIYYLVEKKTKIQYHIFRLPFLLTLLALFYTAIKPEMPFTATAIIIILVWFCMGVIYGYRASPAMRRVAEKLIACCKNW